MKVNISNIFVQYELDSDVNCKYDIVDANLLMCTQRIDIAAKCLYLRHKDECYDYAKEVYIEHLRAMTKGSFVEPYGHKKKVEDFITAFDELYRDMSINGYAENVSPIPVDRNFRIMDGAHRVAASIVLNLKVPIIQLDIEANYDVYDQEYFEKFGIDEDILDKIIYEYICLASNCLCINVWPSAIGYDEELRLIIEKHFNILYTKDIKLNENGAFYYLTQIYKEYSWAQNIQEGFSGVYRKLLPCFPTFNPVRCFFVENVVVKDLISVKNEMRDLYQLSKHSLHMTDNHEETIDMADIILSNNSLEFLNRCKAVEFKNTFDLMDQAKTINETKKKVTFTGSLVLALYGIREANDVDYFCEDEDKDSHNEYLDEYGLNLMQVLFDPRNKFSFFGLEFLLLERIKEFKTMRGESKDLDDIKLIELVLEGKNYNRKAEFLRKKRRVIAKAQGVIIRLSHKIGLYEEIRGLYKKIKRKK